MNTVERITKLLNGWSDAPKILVAHEDSPQDVKELAMIVGSTVEILERCKELEGKNTTLYVAGPLKLVYGLRQIKPNFNIWHLDDEQHT